MVSPSISMIFYFNQLTYAYRDMIEHPDLSRRNLKSLQVLYYGGAPAGDSLPVRIKERLPWVSVGQGYGKLAWARSILHVMFRLTM